MHNWCSLTSCHCVGGGGSSTGFKVEDRRKNRSLQLITDFQKAVHPVASGKIFFHLFTKLRWLRLSVPLIEAEVATGEEPGSDMIDSLWICRRELLGIWGTLGDVLDLADFRETGTNGATESTSFFPGTCTSLPVTAPDTYPLKCSPSTHKT